MDSKKLLEKILAWCKAHNITIEIVSEKELHDFMAVNDAAAKPLGFDDMGKANIKISRERNGVPISDDYFLRTLYHELVERKLMKDDDMTYWQAHLKALDAEKDVKKSRSVTDGQGDVGRIQPDDEDKTEIEKADVAFGNVIEFEGQKYVDVGNTFRTDIDVPVGAVIEVSVQELTITNGKLTWAKPQVIGIDNERALPYSASKALNIASKYEGVLQKAEKRSASQDDLQEFDEGGREKFNVKTGDVGVLSIDEHITFLDEEAASEFKDVKSYSGWNSAKQRLASHSGSIHNDLRVKLGATDFLQGFTATIGNTHDRNKIVHNQEGDKLLVVSFKAHTPHGKIKWQTDVGQSKAWIFEPGEIGSPGKRWSAIFKIEKKAKIEFGRVDEHFLEMKITGTSHMLEGRWVLMFAPLEPDKRTWLFMRPKKQEFDEPSLNIKPMKKSLLKAVLEHRG